MPEIFQSSHFGFLPALEDVVEQVEAAKLGCVRNIELFKFSSCTPAFQVDLERTDGSADRIVMRGEQQNDLLVMSPEERSIEKEIWMLNRVRDLAWTFQRSSLTVVSLPFQDSIRKEIRRRSSAFS
jgi:hypothetical protein